MGTQRWCSLPARMKNAILEHDDQFLRNWAGYKGRFCVFPFFLGSVNFEATNSILSHVRSKEAQLSISNIEQIVQV